MKILITGASKGIGLQIAKELAERGYELVLHCNSTEKALLAFVDEIKTRIILLRQIYLQSLGLLIFLIKRVKQLVFLIQ